MTEDEALAAGVPPAHEATRRHVHRWTLLSAHVVSTGWVEYHGCPCGAIRLQERSQA